MELPLYTLRMIAEHVHTEFLSIMKNSCNMCAEYLSDEKLINNIDEDAPLSFPDYTDYVKRPRFVYHIFKNHNLLHILICRKLGYDLIDIACGYGYIDEIKWLADNYTVSVTPMSYPETYGYNDICYSQTNLQITPQSIKMAAENGFDNVVTFMIEKFPNIMKADKFELEEWGNKIFADTIRNGHISTIQLLIKIFPRPTVTLITIGEVALKGDYKMVDSIRDLQNKGQITVRTINP